MAIREFKRKDGTRYQASLLGNDGHVVSEMFDTRKEAREYENKLKAEKAAGRLTGISKKVSLNEYVQVWFKESQSQTTPGHRSQQVQLYEDFVAPKLGGKPLAKITPPMVLNVLNEMRQLGKSAQTRLHVFNLLRKAFGDAIEIYQMVDFNPVLKKIKPKVPRKETVHLSGHQMKTLLQHVAGKEYCLAIWLQLVLGLRIGEVQALDWSDVDLQLGVLYVRRSYSRKDSWATGRPVLNDYPKNKRHRSQKLPPEVLQLLKEEKLRSRSNLVVATSFKGNMLSYEHYMRTLKAYCRQVELPEVGTHGLRHSTASLYMDLGATRDDIASLLDNPSAVDRYIHAKNRPVDKIADVLRMFPVVPA